MVNFNTLKTLPKRIFRKHRTKQRKTVFATFTWDFHGAVKTSAFMNFEFYTCMSEFGLCLTSGSLAKAEWKVSKMWNFCMGPVYGALRNLIFMWQVKLLGVALVCGTVGNLLPITPQFYWRTRTKCFKLSGEKGWNDLRTGMVLEVLETNGATTISQKTAGAWGILAGVTIARQWRTHSCWQMFESFTHNILPISRLSCSRPPMPTPTIYKSLCPRIWYMWSREARRCPQLCPVRYMIQNAHAAIWHFGVPPCGVCLCVWVLRCVRALKTCISHQWANEEGTLPTNRLRPINSLQLPGAMRHFHLTSVACSSDNCSVLFVAWARASCTCFCQMMFQSPTRLTVWHVWHFVSRMVWRYICLLFWHFIEHSIEHSIDHCVKHSIKHFVGIPNFSTNIHSGLLFPLFQGQRVF